MNVFEYIEKNNSADGISPPFNIESIWKKAKVAQLPNGEDFWQTKIKVNPDYEKDLNEIGQGFVNNINTYIKNIKTFDKFLEHMGIKQTDIFSSSLPNGQSTIKALNKFKNKIPSSDWNGVAYCGYVISSLQSLYSLNPQIEKINKIEPYLTITTDPIFFAKLSKYGCDHGSCFGSSNSAYKYKARALDNSVVCIVTDKAYTKDQMINVNNALARCFGIINDSKAIFTNFYQKTITRSDVAMILLTALKEHFNKDIKAYDKLGNGPYTIPNGSMYTNGDIMLFSTKKEKEGTAKNPTFTINIHKDNKKYVNKYNL